MSNREALVAVAVAFLVGVLVAGSLRESGPTPQKEPGATIAGPTLRWRITSAFGTHLPALGENPLEVAERLRRASRGRRGGASVSARHACRQAAAEAGHHRFEGLLLSAAPACRLWSCTGHWKASGCTNNRTLTAARTATKTASSGQVAERYSWGNGCCRAKAAAALTSGCRASKSHAPI